MTHLDNCELVIKIGEQEFTAHLDESLDHGSDRGSEPLEHVRDIEPDLGDLLQELENATTLLGDAVGNLRTEMLLEQQRLLLHDLQHRIHDLESALVDHDKLTTRLDDLSRDLSLSTLNTHNSIKTLCQRLGVDHVVHDSSSPVGGTSNPQPTGEGPSQTQTLQDGC